MPSITPACLRLLAVQVRSAPTYASNFAYRAWGGIRDFDFGNASHQHMNFNSRLLNTSMTLSNGSITANWFFDYYADGKLQKVTDANNPIFDRAFDHDHMDVFRRRELVARRAVAQLPMVPSNRLTRTMSGKHHLAHFSLLDGKPASRCRIFHQQPATYWSDDNEGKLGFDFDAIYGYDAAVDKVPSAEMSMLGLADRISHATSNGNLANLRRQFGAG